MNFKSFFSIGILLFALCFQSIAQRPSEDSIYREIKTFIEKDEQNILIIRTGQDTVSFNLYQRELNKYCTEYYAAPTYTRKVEYGWGTNLTFPTTIIYSSLNSRTKIVLSNDHLCDIFSLE